MQGAFHGRAGHTATAILSGKNAGKVLIAGGVKRDGKGGVEPDNLYVLGRAEPCTQC